MEPTTPTTPAPDPVTSVPNPPVVSQEPELRRYWLAGFISGALTLLFFMLIVILSILNYAIPCSGRFPAVAVLALGVALGLSFIGGAATAEGTLPLPAGLNSPVKFAVAGGVASLVLVLWIGWFFYARDCTDAPETKQETAEKLLDEAWDLMGGRPGSAWVDAQGQLTPEARTDLEKARRKVGEALALNPRSDRAHELRAIYLARSGHRGDAERELRILIQNSPKYAHAYNSLGNVLGQQGRLKDSIAYYRLAVTKDPDYVVAYYNLGNALYNAERFNEAITAYSECLKRDSSFARAFNNRGTTYHKLHNLDRAIADYHKAIEIEPKLPEAHESLGDALMALGRRTEAIEAYQRAAELAPSRAELTQKLASARAHLNAVPSPSPIMPSEPL